MILRCTHKGGQFCCCCCCCFFLIALPPSEFMPTSIGVHLHTLWHHILLMAFGLRWSVCVYVHKSLTLFHVSIFIPVIFAVYFIHPLLSLSLSLSVTQNTHTLSPSCTYLTLLQDPKHCVYYNSNNNIVMLMTLFVLPTWCFFLPFSPFYTWIIIIFSLETFHEPWCINRWNYKVFFRQTYGGTHFIHPQYGNKNETYI